MKNSKIGIIVLVIICALAALFIFKGNKDSKTEAVTAAPVSETKIEDTTSQKVPATEEKKADEPKVTEPVVEVSAVETPVVETPVVEASVVEAPAVEIPVVENTVVEEVAVIENAEILLPEETKKDEPAVAEPVIEVVVVAEPAVEEKVEKKAEIAVEPEPIAEEKIIDDSALSVAAYVSPFSFHGLYFRDYDPAVDKANLLSTYGLGAKIKARYNFYNNCYVALEISEQTYFEKHYKNYNDVLFAAKLGHKSYFCEKAYTFGEAGIGLDIASFDNETKAYLDAILEFGFGYAITDNLVAEVSEEVVYNYQKKHDNWLNADSFCFNTYIGLVYKF